MTEIKQPSQPGAIKVFLSYSWDLPEHEDKVMSFTQHLRKNGFEAHIDKMLSQGETAIHFVSMMHKSMQSADKVIIVLSAGYKEKAESFTGGVGEEYRLLLTDIDKNPKKYILVSFSGTSDAITPMGLRARDTVDLSKEGEEERLFAKLQDRPLYEFSEVGSTLPQIKAKKPVPFEPGNPNQVNPPTAEFLLNLHNGMSIHFFYRIASRNYKMRKADAENGLGFNFEQKNAALKLLYYHNLIEHDGTMVWATNLGKAVFSDYNLYESDEIFDGSLAFAILKFLYTLNDFADADCMPRLFADHAPQHSSSYSNLYNLMQYIGYNSDMKGFITTSRNNWYALSESGKARYLYELKRRQRR